LSSLVGIGGSKSSGLAWKIRSLGDFIQDTKFCPVIRPDGKNARKVDEII
jgi:hypothetical protein